MHDEESKVGARALQGLGAGRRDGEGRLKWGSIRPERGDEAARRGTKKARPRGAGRAGGGLGAKIT